MEPHVAKRDIRSVKPDEVYGRLTVLWKVPSTTAYSRWMCRCSCGKMVEIMGRSLKSGATRSCGCLSLESAKQRFVTHGDCYSITYKSWAAMLSRCRDPKSTGYKNYGGRGITYHKPWESYETFLADMGERPSLEHSLDRIDADGNYEPANCRWASRYEQAINTRRAIGVTYNGEHMPLLEYCKIHELDYAVMKHRIGKMGMSLVDATVMPIMREKVYLTVRGEQLRLKEFCDRHNLSLTTVAGRVKRNWSGDEIYDNLVLGKHVVPAERSKSGASHRRHMVPTEDGEVTLREYCRTHNLDYSTAVGRIARGWDPLKAVTTPIAHKER